MTATLEQHLFTARGYRYETTAASLGITPKIRAQIESMVGRYAAQSPGDHRLAKWVYRGARLPSCGGWVASILTDAEPAFGRDNYIAHSFVVPDAVMAAQHYNLAWIASRLPFDRDHRPDLSETGVSLEPLTIELDPRQQFELLSLVLDDLGVELVQQAIERLIDGGKERKVLTWPAPPGANDYWAFANAANGESAPRGDVIPLLRLAGVMALLPAAFKGELAFSVNEPPGGNERVSVPAPGIPIVSPRAGLPWFNECAEHARKGHIEPLRQVQDRLSALMPVGVAASAETLARAFAFCRPSVSGSQAVRVGWESAASRVAPLEGCDVDVEAVFRIARESVDEAKPGSARPFFAALIKVSEATKRPLPDLVLSEVLDHLHDGRESSATHVAFLKTLSTAMQARIWEESARRAIFPGGLAEDAPIADLSFVLGTFTPSLGLSPDALDAVLRNLSARLSHGQKSYPSALTPASLAGLCTLARTSPLPIDVRSGLLEALAREWASEIQTTTESVRRQVQHVSDDEAIPTADAGTLRGIFREILAAHLFGGLPAQALAAVTLELGASEPSQVVGAVLDHIVEPSIRLLDCRDFVDGLRGWQPGPGKRVLRCFAELIEKRVDSQKMNCGHPCDELPQFAGWVTDFREGRFDKYVDRPRESQHYAAFLPCMRRATSEERQSRPHGLVLGACYLRLVPDENIGLAAALVRVAVSVERDVSVGGRWRGRTHAIALADALDACAHSSRTQEIDEICNSIARIAERCHKEELALFLSELTEYLRLTKGKLPNVVQKFLRDPTRKPGEGSGWNFLRF